MDTLTLYKMADKKTQNRFRKRKQRGMNLHGMSAEEALSYASQVLHPDLSSCVKPQEPTPAEVQREVAKLKAMGLMTETPAVKTEIVSDAQFSPHLNRIESIHSVVFKPSQQIVVSVPTHSENWIQNRESEPQTLVTYSIPHKQPLVIVPSPSSSANLSWLKSIFCASGFIVFSGALIALGGEAGGGTKSAYFWSTIIVMSSTILLSIPHKKGSHLSLAYKLIGALVLAIGYMTLHSGVKTQEEQMVSVNVDKNPKVVRLQHAVKDLEDRVQPYREKIKTTDAVLYWKRLNKLLEEAAPIERQLAAARIELEAAQIEAKNEAKTGLSQNWATVEWLRRLILEPLNMLCLHGFLQTLPELMAIIGRVISAFRMKRANMLRVNFVH